MELTNLSEITSLLKTHGLYAKKRFGQNFLINPGILGKIVESAEIEKTDTVIEIGPGLGTLTKKLSEKSSKVIALELDTTLLPVLKETLKDCLNIEIINIDALKFTPPNIEYKLVANIPYYITSPILNHFLQAENKPKSLTLLVQKEVADKICSKDDKMSVLSLEVAIFGKAKITGKVSKGSFYPAPKVDSAILYIEPYAKKDPNYLPKEKALKILELAKKAFTHKRKKLSHTFKNLPKEIDPGRRPETLSVKEWFLILEHLS